MEKKAESKLQKLKQLSKKKFTVGKISSTRLSIKDQSYFAKRLSFLIKANVPLLESLHMIREQTMSKRHASVFDGVIHDVSNGQFLSTSLSRYPKTFSELAINIINVGESTGILSENLEYLAEELKKKLALRRKIIGAFVYPAVVTVATLGITAFLMVYLFPKLMPVFTSLNVKLPWSTRIIIALSDFLRNYGFELIVILTILSVGIVAFIRKSKKFHFLYDKTILKLPLVGNIIRSYNLANLSRTLGLLLKSGITLSEALPMTAKSTNNLVYKKRISGT